MNDSNARRGASAKIELDDYAAAQRAKTEEIQLVATVSHDLRQPLQSISLLNAALSQRAEDAAIREIASLQRESLDQMTELLDTLLEICSRTSASR